MEKGDSSPLREGRETGRARERGREEERYVPVIIKRTDESLRHPDDILQAAINEGLEQLHRRSLSLALSSVVGGLTIGFTAMAVAVVTGALGPEDGALLQRVGPALVYPLGFVMCLMSGSQLFTEHTATAVYPILDRKAGVAGLVRLWGVVAFGNLIGAAVAALLLIWAEPVVGARDGYLEVGRNLVAHSSAALLASSVLAGWLMALAAWLILATPPRVSQVVLIYIVTFLIGLGRLHHSIAGAVELFTSLLVREALPSWDSLRFLALALGGNLLGGSFFVAVLNYGHIRQSQMAED